MIYDHLLTFEREVSLVWLSPWSIVKILFLLARYMPFVSISAIVSYALVTTTSTSVCYATLLLTQWSVFFGSLASEGILFVRTWAVWDCNTHLAIALVVIMFGATAVGVILLVLWKSTLVISTNFSEYRTARCYIVHESGLHAATSWVIITLEALVLILTIIRMARQYRLVGKERFQSEFVTVLYRDGVVFFLFVSIVNIVIMLSAKGIDRNILVILQQVLHSVLSSRVILHLREIQRKERSMQSMSDVVFPPTSRLITGSATNDEP